VNGDETLDDKSAGHDFVEPAATIVAAYVSNNSVPAKDLGSLIASIHTALIAAARGQEAPQSNSARPTPPVPIKKSITADFLVSLEDGQRYKSLKRHLSGRGLSPQQYREKWGLPPNYPMVAPNYAKQRSELAKAAGLGTQKNKTEAAAKSSRKPATRAKASKA